MVALAAALLLLQAFPDSLGAHLDDLSAEAALELADRAAGETTWALISRWRSDAPAHRPLASQLRLSHELAAWRGAILADHDPGEPRLLDQITGYLETRPFPGVRVIGGTFRVRGGSGLAVGSPRFGSPGRAGSIRLSSTSSLRGYSGSSIGRHFRGVAASVSTSRVKGLAWLSRGRLDGTVDSTQVSVFTRGRRRTTTELERRNALRANATGVLLEVGRAGLRGGALVNTEAVAGTPEQAMESWIVARRGQLELHATGALCGCSPGASSAISVTILTERGGPSAAFAYRRYGKRPRLASPLSHTSARVAHEEGWTLALSFPTPGGRISAGADQAWTETARSARALATFHNTRTLVQLTTWSRLAEQRSGRYRTQGRVTGSRLRLRASMGHNPELRAEVWLAREEGAASGALRLLMTATMRRTRLDFGIADHGQDPGAPTITTYEAVPRYTHPLHVLAGRGRRVHLRARAKHGSVSLDLFVAYTYRAAPSPVTQDAHQFEVGASISAR